jgi:hypothetical protein
MTTAPAEAKAETKRNAKDEVRALLDLLPDDVTLEDIQYHLDVAGKVLRAESGPSAKVGFRMKRSSGGSRHGSPSSLVTRRARRPAEIRAYLEHRTPVDAERVVNRIAEAAESPSEFPLRGRIFWSSATLTDVKRSSIGGA